MIHGNTTDHESQVSGDNQISVEHIQMLKASGISDEVIQARGYKTITNRFELKDYGFLRGQLIAPTLLIPVHSTDGQIALNTHRPDNPRVIEEKDKRKNPDGTYPNRVLKYEQPKGMGLRLDCSPVCQPKLADPSVPLWITEGVKKGDSLVSAGLCAIALMGVWGFKGKNEFGTTTFLADWDYVALDGRDVRIVFDSDVMDKPGVKKALERLVEHLQRKGAKVAVVYLPNEDGKGKVGVDDWLAASHSVEDLEALVEAPRLTPKPAPPRVRLLDAYPIEMKRPLELLEGRAYAAAWLPVEVTISEGMDKNGNIVRYDPPKTETETRLFIIRDDGVFFGEGGDKPIEDLRFVVNLPFTPGRDKIWSPKGVLAYRAENRADPIDVFSRIVESVDHFIDFERSLTDQQTMTEFIACYILATWFLDAFNVIGYLWPNGERGSGKTNLLLIVARLSYLGMVVLAGGTYATLRDLSDYGATLAFDDAENLSDPSKSDADKRALLLAGNRREATVTVKEPVGSREWRIRFVSTYGARLFSAISFPDPVLASRTVLVPLIRTTDLLRANIDPADNEIWPHDLRDQVDDLWSLALSFLPEMKKWNGWVGNNSTLTGRQLQPWRAVLAVARFLDEKGVKGLYARMGQLAQDYQKENLGYDHSDYTILIIRAILRCATRAESASSAISKPDEKFTMTVSEITITAKKIVVEEDWNIGLEKITNGRTGKILSRLRFKEAPRPEGAGSRRREFTLRDLYNLSRSYGVAFPPRLAKIIDPSLDIPPDDGTSGIDGTSGPEALPELQPEPSLDEHVTQLTISSLEEIPQKTCYACRGNNWVAYPNNGGYYCGNCHPDPKSLAGAAEGD